MKRAYRNTASFGRRQEYIVAAELLKRGFDVYMTLVDDQGIDCVIRLDESRYIDVQIKARSKDVKHWNFFAAMTFQPRDNLWFIFVTEKTGDYWTMPSRDVFRFGYQNKKGINKGKVSLRLPGTYSGKKAILFEKYRGGSGFQLMRSNVL